MCRSRMWQALLGSAVFCGLMAQGMSAWGANPGLQPLPSPPPPLRFELGGEVTLYTEAPPELTIRAASIYGDWQLSAEISHSLLTQSPSRRIQLSERIRRGPLALSIGLAWEDQVGFTAQANLHWNEDEEGRKLIVNGQASPQGMSGLLNGYLEEQNLKLKVEQLRFTEGRLELLKEAELLWTPVPWLLISVRADRSGLQPLQLKLQSTLAGRLNLSLAGEFAGEERLRLLGFDVGLARDGYGVGVRLSPEGRWQEIRVEGAHSLPLALVQTRLEGKIRFRPEGWQSLQLEALLSEALFGGPLQAQLNLERESWDFRVSPRFSWGLGSSLQSTLIWKAGGLWSLHVEGQLLETAVFLQGKADLGSAGVGSLQLMSDVTLESLSLSTMANYAPGSWFLDLSATLPLDSWELLATSRWSSTFGWESGSFGVNRTWLLNP